MTVSERLTTVQSPIRTATKSGIYRVTISSSRGESDEYKQVEAQIKYQERTEIQYLLASSDVAQLERRVEDLRDDLLKGNTALSEQEMNLLKGIFNCNKQLIAQSEKSAQLILVALASLLEALIENSAYSDDIQLIVRNLLKSSSTSLRYAALDVIAAGLGIVSIAGLLLEEANDLLKNEEPGYVLDYLESL